MITETIQNYLRTWMYGEMRAYGDQWTEIKIQQQITSPEVVCTIISAKHAACGTTVHYNINGLPKQTTLLEAVNTAMRDLFLPVCPNCGMPTAGGL